VTKSCIIILAAGEAQEQAYPRTHCIENASVMVQISAGACGLMI